MLKTQSRKLAAILAADIAGYSALMGCDEARTVRDLKAHQAVVLPMIGEFGGRIIDTAGDGILAEFASVVSAVECAVAIQEKMAERNAAIEPDWRMQFRIGINIGDVIFDETRIYGDGINIAARLEGIAQPGGVLISRQAYDQVHGKLALRFRKLGSQKLKNIAAPIEVFAIDISDKWDSLSSTKPKVQSAARQWLPLRLFLTYAITPVIVLLLAHYLIVMKLDLDPAFLRIFSLLLPTFVGFILSRQTGHGLGAAFLLGATAGIMSVFGMIAIVGFVDSTTTIPSSPFEWQEAMEYAVGITLATMFGSVLARAANSVLSAVGGH